MSKLEPGSIIIGFAAFHAERGELEVETFATTESETVAQWNATQAGKWELASRRGWRAQPVMIAILVDDRPATEKGLTP